ncbi:MAG: DUF1549 domain-containing protein [Rubripirellula sp.]
MLRFVRPIVVALLLLTVGSAEDLDSSLQITANSIDQRLNDSFQHQQISPVAHADDAEFCRRVWLDLAGVAPPISDVRSFLNDNNEDKRGRLIDRLLESPQYASHMASRWNAILLPADAQNQLGQQQNVSALHQWLRTQFRDNVPYDYFVGGFLTAGGAGDTGPAIFYTSHSLEPEKLAAATSRIFMGIQLQCAQCHDHPFDRWTQEDFWHYAAFFSQLQQTDAQGRDAMIEDRVGGEVTLPETENVMAPRYPGVQEAPEPDPENIRRRQLTIWMASRDNPYFARAAVNRAWAHLFGRGLVDPVDAMDADNKPSHPELLDFLTDEFTKQRFDLRKLYATLARTEAYARTSRVDQQQRPPADSFASMAVKTLTPEQYFDSLQQNVYRRSAPRADDTMSSDRATRQRFLNRMQASETTSQDYPHGVVQVLGLMNGPEMAVATSDPNVGLLGTLQAPFFSDQDRIETLFLATLSRLPTDQEAEQFMDHLSVAGDSVQKQTAIRDLLWVLLNTAECAVCP